MTDTTDSAAQSGTGHNDPGTPTGPGDRVRPGRAHASQGQTTPNAVLHVGTMKSGTSYLQAVLEKNSGLLAEDGVHYFGRGTRAIWDLLNLRDRSEKQFTGAWKRVVRRMHRSDAPQQLLSMELLSLASPDEVHAIAESLPGLRAIVTARDFARIVPSAWQNVIKHASTKTFAQFTEALLSAEDSRTKERFWRQQDVAAIVERWSAVLGPASVYFVTVPPTGAPPTLLWERFCTVLGVSPSRYDTTAEEANTSLTYSDAELLRRVNARVRTKLDDRGYNRYVRVFLANEVMRPRARDSSSEQAAALERTRSEDVRDVPALGPAVHEWATHRALDAVARVRASGVHVVGDLDDLVPAPYQGNGSEGPEDPPLTVYPETAVRTIAHLLTKLNDLDPDAREVARLSPRDAAREARAERSRQRMARDQRAIRASSTPAETTP